jgi:hypothetical protein
MQGKSSAGSKRESVAGVNITPASQSKFTPSFHDRIMEHFIVFEQPEGRARPSGSSLAGVTGASGLATSLP